MVLRASTGYFLGPTPSRKGTGRPEFTGHRHLRLTAPPGAAAETGPATALTRSEGRRLYHSQTQAPGACPGVRAGLVGGGGDEAAGLIRGFVPLAKVLTGTASPPSAWIKLFDLHLPHFRGPCCSNRLQQSVEYADYASFALQSILAAPPTQPLKPIRPHQGSHKSPQFPLFRLYALSSSSSSSFGPLPSSPPSSTPSAASCLPKPSRLPPTCWPHLSRSLSFS